jgi:hypothetical protein
MLRFTHNIGLVLILLLASAWARSEYTPLGYTLTNGTATFSCWLVEHETLGRVVAVKIIGQGREGEAIVPMKLADLEKLKLSCQQAFAYRKPMKEGDKVVIGTIDVKTSRMDVVVVHGQGVTAVYLLARQEGREPTFVLTAPQRENFYALIDQGVEALRKP